MGDASHQMRHCRTAQRLILILTDGEPHDIDVFDSSHLVLDAALAMDRSAAEGTPVFCVSVDPPAEGYLKKIFGLHHFRVIDNVQQLPQRLPEPAKFTKPAFTSYETTIGGLLAARQRCRQIPRHNLCRVAKAARARWQPPMAVCHDRWCYRADAR